MEVAIHEAKGKLSALIRAASRGENVRLTSHGKAVAEIKAIRPDIEAQDKLAAIRKIQVSAQKSMKKSISDDAQNTSDFLYDEDGMPQ